jgi:putative transposase
MEKYKNKYRNDSIRLKNWDYGSSGCYFITICTKNREQYFGRIVNNDETHNENVRVRNGAGSDMRNGAVVGTQNFASLRATPIGKIAHQYWTEIPDHFPFVKLDEFILMPDHVHGVLCIDRPGYYQWVKNKFAPQSQNLASVIRGYKAGVKKYATLNNIEFAWQPRFYEHIVRSANRLTIIRQYIKNNPAQWAGKTK